MPHFMISGAVSQTSGSPPAEYYWAYSGIISDASGEDMWVYVLDWDAPGTSGEAQIEATNYYPPTSSLENLTCAVENAQDEWYKFTCIEM